MVIETERLRIRPFEVSDAEWYFKVTKDRAIKKYLLFAHPSSVKDSVRMIWQYYSKDGFIYKFSFVLENKESHERLGALMMEQNLDESLGISMLIAKEHRRKGYISEVIEGVVRHLPNGNVLKFSIDRQNEASLMAVQKLDKIVEITDSFSENITKQYRIFALET